MEKKLLVETQSFTPKLKSNKLSPNGNLLVDGILATVEVKNGNGRYYKRELWERELNKYQDIILQNRATGELDHPDSPIINLKNVSHCIRKTWWDGDNIMGEIEILPTPSGNILSALLKSNIQLGVSSRGLGSLEERGDLLEVQDDFELTCFDFVSTPSNPDSWMSLIKEGKQPSINKYLKVNTLITDILCSQGQCPIL